MKTALKISLWLNLVLITGFILMVSATREITEVLQRPPLVINQTPAKIPPPKPFRWSQIESTNYVTYIRNLREIGCPEQTIRDLIVADVSQLYKARGETMEATAEKTSIIEYLLGGIPSTIARASVPPTFTPENKKLPAAVSMPLVFQEADVDRIHLDPIQLDAVIELRQRFLDKIGGARRDPNDPAYLNEWQKAQPEIDEALAGTIGRKAYLEYEALAASQVR